MANFVGFLVGANLYFFNLGRVDFTGVSDVVERINDGVHMTTRRVVFLRDLFYGVIILQHINRFCPIYVCTHSIPKTTLPFQNVKGTCDSIFCQKRR